MTYTLHGASGKHKISQAQAYDMIAKNKCQRTQMGKTVIYYFASCQVEVKP